MAETGTASIISASVSTAATFTIAPAGETSALSGVYSVLYGSWISDQLVLPGMPVTGSVIRWEATIPPDTTVAVSTSIDNGLTWDPATHNTPVARLQTGDTVTRSVIAKIEMTRASVVAPGPSVSYLELQVSCDSSTDELLSIGYGLIDKVTTHATGGTRGSSGGSSGVGSGAVTSHGGGAAGGGSTITVHAIDLSLAIQRNVWQQPYIVPGGITYDQAVAAMVKNRLPSQTAFNVTTTTHIVPDVIIYGATSGGDPWKDIRELAAAIGFECFFDPTGVFVFQPVRDPRYGIPVWQFDETMNPLVAEAKRELGADQTYNDIVVIGQSSSSANAVSAEAMDLDPSSRTYILGSFGRVAQRITFPLIKTQAAAQAAAAALLANSIGGSDTVTITCVPHPALEPGDIVRINCSNVRVNGTYMINSMTTSLSPADPQQLVCFRQSTTAM